MSAHGFKSVFMVASVAGAALGCYLVSLNVASERAKLEAVESKIVLAQRDIRVLQTEIGTRGRLAQLERWNVGFIRLSAPTADQFLEGGFQLATMTKPDAKPVIDAPVVLVWPPAQVTAVPFALASARSAATSAPDVGRATPSGTMTSPEASAEYARRTPSSRSTLVARVAAVMRCGSARPSPCRRPAVRADPRARRPARCRPR